MTEEKKSIKNGACPLNTRSYNIEEIIKNFSQQLDKECGRNERLYVQLVDIAQTKVGLWVFRAACVGLLSAIVALAGAFWTLSLQLKDSISIVAIGVAVNAESYRTVLERIKALEAYQLRSEIDDRIGTMTLKRE